MNLYRMTLTPLSPLGTPLQSDTLFGHLCWQIVRREGADGFRAFIEPFLTGEPMFVLSDGFPEGYLPRPLVPVGAPPAQGSGTDYASVKKWRKAPFVTLEQFRETQRGLVPEAMPPSVQWRPVERLHASLDRNTGRTGGDDSAGALYQTTSHLPAVIRDSGETFTTRISVYARASGEHIGILCGLMEELSRVGYGKDKSSGAGQFAFDGKADCVLVDDLDRAENANGFVSLSSLVPAKGDPHRGYWRLRTKRGRLGEERALSADPFKRTLVQMEPGAAFFLSGPLKPWYGRVVRNIAPAFAEVVQNCQSIAVPMHIPIGGG